MATTGIGFNPQSLALAIGAAGSTLTDIAAPAAFLTAGSSSDIDQSTQLRVFSDTCQSPLIFGNFESEKILAVSPGELEHSMDSFAPWWRAEWLQSKRPNTFQAAQLFAEDAITTGPAIALTRPILLNPSDKKDSPQEIKVAGVLSDPVASAKALAPCIDWKMVEEVMQPNLVIDGKPITFQEIINAHTSNEKMRKSFNFLYGLAVFFFASTIPAAAFCVAVGVSLLWPVALACLAVFLLVPAFWLSKKTKDRALDNTKLKPSLHYSEAAPSTSSPDFQRLWYLYSIAEWWKQIKSACELTVKKKNVFTPPDAGQKGIGSKNNAGIKIIDRLQVFIDKARNFVVDGVVYDLTTIDFFPFDKITNQLSKSPDGVIPLLILEESGFVPINAVKALKPEWNENEHNSLWMDAAVRYLARNGNDNVIELLWKRATQGQDESAQRLLEKLAMEGNLTAQAYIESAREIERLPHPMRMRIEIPAAAAGRHDEGVSIEVPVGADPKESKLGR